MGYDIESSMYQNDLTHKEIDEMIFNKLFCPHKHKRVILWYNIASRRYVNYAIETHRTEICERCGKTKVKNAGVHEDIFRDMFNYKRMLLESQGYIPERDYPYELDQVIEELGFTEK